MEDGSGRSFRHRTQQATSLVRIGVALALEQRIRPWRWLGAVVAVLGLFPLVQGPRWVGVVLMVLGAAIWITVTAIVRLVVRILTPAPVQALRHELQEALGEVKAAARETGVPLGIGDGIRFAWATARGRRPHRGVAAKADLFAERLREALGPSRFDRLVERAPEEGPTAS